MNVRFTIEFTPDGRARIKLPEGKMQQVDANAIAAMTDALSKAMGTVEERHVGKFDVHGNHYHDHDDHGHDHVHGKKE